MMGLSGCAVLDPPHQAIGPSQTLQDDVRNHELAGLEGHRSVYVCDAFPAMVPERAQQPPVYRRPTRTIPVASRTQAADSVRAGGVMNAAGVLVGKPLLSAEFFSHKHSRRFVKPCFSEARTQKARCTARPREPGDGACMYYLSGVLCFYVSMKRRQCERKPGPDMLSVNATSAVVPFCMLCKTSID